MSGKTDCPLCNKSLYHSGLKKHMFSKNHINIWRNHLNRRKFQECFDTGARNRIQIKNVHLCFGCKLYFRNDNTYHSCPNKAKTLEFVKSILDVPAIKPEPKEAPPTAPTAPPTPQVDVEKLKKEIAQLTDDLFVADGKNELVDEFQDALKFVLKFIKSENPELYDTIKDNLDDYPAVLKLI